MAKSEFPYKNNTIVGVEVNGNSIVSGGPPKAFVSENSDVVAEYTPATKAIVPLQNLDGSFSASNTFKSDLVNNFTLKETIDLSARSATQEYLGGAGVSQEDVNAFLGTTVSATSFASPSETQTGPNGGISPNPTPTQSQPSNSASSDQSGGSGLRYPLSKGLKEDSITFEAREYSPQAADALGSRQGTCILAIQPSISDSNTVGWGDGRINAFQAAVFDAAKAGIGQGFGAMGDKARAAAEAFYNDTNKGADFQIYAAGQAAQVNDAFVRETGKILNPNLELLFQGPELRSFSFTFQLSARSKLEATNIKKIIRFFKKNMAPNKSSNDIFLKAPNVFKITYNQKESLNKFKTCALRSFSVDYTPLGTYMTFEDGTMVSYALTMSFQELFPLYNTSEDYGSETEIGY